MKYLAAKYPRRQMLIGLLLALVMSAVVPVHAFAQQTQQDVQILHLQILYSDGLIYQQEKLLNAYRCRFNIDTIVVPGGCQDGVSAVPLPVPLPFTGIPTTEEKILRDSTVLSQETLLNVYRCMFSIDTQIVPQGCPERNQTAATPITSGGSSSSSAGKVVTPLTDTSKCSFADYATNAIDAVWQVRAGQNLGTAFHLGQYAEHSWWLTAEHVIRDAGSIRLTHGGQSLIARIVLADRGEDIAVLSTSPSTAAELQLGGLSTTRPGSDIFAVGFPLYVASTPSITRGIVSRVLEDPILGRVLQTDTAVNPGNSGGPMLNSCGYVLGMVVSKAAAVGSEGINYSVIEPKLLDALTFAQADPNQSPAPPSPPKPAIGVDAPGPGEWQQSSYSNGDDYLWHVYYLDENGNGAVVYEFPCGKDYYNLAIWTTRWDALALDNLGYIRFWEESSQSTVSFLRANVSQHTSNGATRFALRREFNTGAVQDSDRSYRFYFELLDSFQNRGVLLSFISSPAHTQMVEEALTVTRREVAC
ncbi:MAG: trypsin-like peptidase domain-containing protein [Acidimicrobiia bacterium]|nr:trypsin-like peptidase domain-containing protein [Acidimicrobiia bacterium]